jgi:hypothetical protein
VGTGTKEDESSTGRVWAAGFHHVTARSRFARFEPYEPFISSIFQVFFRVAVISGELKQRVLNQWIRGRDLYLHSAAPQTVTVSIPKSSQLLLYREIIVCFDDHAGHL